MPVKGCSENGRPGYKYGDQGKCYTYKAGDPRSRKAAYDKARAQGSAIEKSRGRW